MKCWAQRAGSQHFCDWEAGHQLSHGVMGGSDPWWDSECAPDTRANGRKTAAMRILELSHDADRAAFIQDCHSEWPGFLRAIAARLRVDTVAACADLSAIQNEIGDGAGLLEDDTMVRLIAAADILRPFAEDS